MLSPMRAVPSAADTTTIRQKCMSPTRGRPVTPAPRVITRAPSACSPAAGTAGLGESLARLPGPVWLLQESITDSVMQSEPRRLDDVAVDADGSPFPLPIRRFD